jgi:hypothetical protein
MIKYQLVLFSALLVFYFQAGGSPKNKSQTGFPPKALNPLLVTKIALSLGKNEKLDKDLQMYAAVFQKESKNNLDDAFYLAITLAIAENKLDLINVLLQIPDEKLSLETVQYRTLAFSLIGQSRGSSDYKMALDLDRLPPDKYVRFRAHLNAIEQAEKLCNKKALNDYLIEIDEDDELGTACKNEIKKYTKHILTKIQDIEPSERQKKAIKQSEEIYTAWVQGPKDELTNTQKEATSLAKGKASDSHQVDTQKVETSLVKDKAADSLIVKNEKSGNEIISMLQNSLNFIPAYFSGKSISEKDKSSINPTDLDVDNLVKDPEVFGPKLLGPKIDLEILAKAWNENDANGLADFAIRLKAEEQINGKVFGKLSANKLANAAIEIAFQTKNKEAIVKLSAAKISEDINTQVAYSGPSRGSVINPYEKISSITKSNQTAYFLYALWIKDCILNPDQLLILRGMFNDDKILSINQKTRLLDFIDKRLNRASFVELNIFAKSMRKDGINSADIIMFENKFGKYLTDDEVINLSKINNGSKKSITSDDLLKQTILSNAEVLVASSGTSKLSLRLGKNKQGAFIYPVVHE